MDDLLDQDATAVASAVQAGEVSAREVVEDALARIEERNPALNAVVELRAEAALEEAAAGPTGPLAGVPFVVKDLGQAVAGMRSTGGSRLCADVVADDDSPLVRRYRAAGLVVVGTTNTPEFGLNGSTEPQLHGPTHNPHALSHSSGGSSGGTAAAVASGMVPAGHGNDGGGSIRIPSSMCGLFGLKPTRGRTPRHPAGYGFLAPQSVDHALTRSVRDSALLLDIGCGPLPGDPYAAPPPARPYVEEVGADPGRLRIAVSTARVDGEATHAACAGAARAMGTLLESLGHEVVEATPPYPDPEDRGLLWVLMSAPLAFEVDERLAALGRPLADDDLEPFTHLLYGIGRETPGADVLRAQHQVEMLGRALAPFFLDHDVLVTPTLPVPPPPLGLLDTTVVESMYEHAGAIADQTSLWNSTGQPAASLPGATTDEGLPVGVQLVAGFGREDVLLRLAGQVEEAQPWPTTPVWPPGRPG